jgi:hypothetical protein
MNEFVEGSEINPPGTGVLKWTHQVGGVLTFTA